MGFINNKHDWEGTTFQNFKSIHPMFLEPISTVEKGRISAAPTERRRFGASLPYTGW